MDTHTDTLTHLLACSLTHSQAHTISPQISQGTNYLHSECDPTHSSICLTQVPPFEERRGALRAPWLLPLILELNF